MTADLKRIRYVTANFHGLQGLKLVPFGLYLWIDAALTYLGFQNTWFIEHGVSTRLVAVVFLALLYWVIAAYYRRAFGQVDRLPEEGGERMFWAMMWMLVGVGLFVVLIAMGGRGLIENGRLTSPLNVIILLITWLVALRFSTHRYAPTDGESIVLGVGMAGGALMALIFEVMALPPFRASRGALAFALLGLATFLVGARHHWLLTRAFQPVPQREESDPFQAAPEEEEAHA